MRKINRMIEGLKSNVFWNKLVHNVISVFCGNTSAAVLNFVTNFLILKKIGSINYAYFILGQQYMLLMDSLLNFQSWKGVIKFGSEALYKKDERELCSIIKNGFLIDVISAMFGMIIALLLIPIIGKIFNWNEFTIKIAYLFSIEIIFHIEGTSIGVLRLLNKFRWSAIESAVTAFVQFVFIGSACLLNANKETILCIFIIFDIISRIGLLILACIVIHKYLSIKNVFTSKRTDLNKEFFKFTMWANVSNTADIPIQYFDIFIISTISTELVSVYKVFKQIVQMFSKVSDPISTAILPQLSELISANRKVEAYRKILQLRNVLYLFTIGILIVCVLLGKQCLNIMFGYMFGENINIFFLMLISYGISFAYVAIHPYFVALGKVREDFIINLFSNIIYTVFAVLMVNILGIYAIVIGSIFQKITNIYCKKIIIKGELR